MAEKSRLKIDVTRERLVIEMTLHSIENVTPESVSNYLVELSKVLDMTVVMQPFCKNFAQLYNPEMYGGFEAWIVWAESGAQVYFWDNQYFLTVDLFTCKSFSTDKAIELTKKFFDVDQLAYAIVPPVLEDNPNNNPKVIISKTGIYKGLIAVEPIHKGEIIAVSDGDVFYADLDSQLPDIARNTAYQFHEKWYRDGKPTSYARFINHSCEPNCGIKNLFQIVTMRDIAAGEELTFDYGMVCNSDWENPEGSCLCGSPNCRGKILPYRGLPQSVKDRYKGYISEWLEK